MKFLADENIDRPVVEKLRSDGLDVKSVDEDDKGIEDDKVLQRAVEENRVLISYDSDFSDPGRGHPGIIRITRLDENRVIAKMIERLAEMFSKQDFENTVVEASPSDFK